MAAGSIFIKLEFWTLVLSSIVLPVAMYVTMIRRRRISRTSVAALGLALILLSGVDTMLLGNLIRLARSSSSLVDDTIFLSESSLAFYVLPLVSAAVGTNLLSQIMINHLEEAEKRRDRELGLSPRDQRG